MLALKRAWAWLTVQDYDNAKAANTQKIVKRLTRGNIAGQNGWYMTKDALDKKSRASDKAARSLEKSLKAVS